MIEVEGVTHLFPPLDDSSEPFVVLDDVNVRVPRGKIVCLLGPSGCGKTTLLNMMAGRLAPTEGTISYDGKRIRGINTAVGYITQHDNLLPWRTLERNVALALELRRLPKGERETRTMEALERVGLERFTHLYPSQLSGGMRKRATLARTLIYDPETLLMDEPFGALDAQLRSGLQADLVRLLQEDGRTVVFVTHDLDEALILGDEVVVFGRDPGRIIHHEILDLPRPRSVFDVRNDPALGAIWARLWQLLGGRAQADAVTWGAGPPQLPEGRILT